MRLREFLEFEEALKEENKKKVQDLLEKFPGLIEERNDNGETPLLIVLHSKSLKNILGLNLSRSHSQSDEDSEPILSILLPFAEKCGVIDDVGSDGNDRTPLYIAIKENRPVAVKLLLEHGADPWAAQKTYSDDNSKIICHQRSPISYAFSKSSTEMADIFVKFYQSLHDSNGRGHASWRTYSTRVEGLTDDLPADEQNNKISLLHSAAAFASAANLMTVIEDIVKDPNIFLGENDKEEIPLHSAVRSHREATEKFKVLYNAVRYYPKHIGQTLMIACQVGAKEVVQIVLQDTEHIIDNAEESLIFATEAGNIDIIKLLLDENIKFLEKKNQNGDTAAHIAVKTENKNILKELLKRWASSNRESIKKDDQKGKPRHSIFSPNKEGENQLTLAIKANERAIVKMLLEKGDWKSLMKNAKYMESSEKTETPLRLLIRQMPDMARLALDKCREEKENGQVKYTIEFVDDMQRDWYTNAQSATSNQKFPSEQDGKRKAEEQGDNSQSATPNQTAPSEKERRKTGIFRVAASVVVACKRMAGLRKERSSNNKHVLNLLVGARNMDLLDHRVVKVTIRHMGSFAVSTFKFSLLTYSLFLVLLTAELFMMDQKVCYGQNHTMSMDGTHETHEYIVLSFLLVVAILELAFGIAVVVLYWRSEQSLIGSVCLQCFTYIYAIIHITVVYGSSRKDEYLRYSMGVLIFLGWLNFMILIRRLPVFGIYVIMFWNVCISFFKFSLVFTIMLVAFAMSFYALFCPEKEFMHIGWALMKTGVMMTGELDYASQWVDPEDDEIINYNTSKHIISIFMYCTFLILMTVLLMNMLVGLAVNDITEVQRYSKFTVLKMEVEHATKYKHNLVWHLRGLCGKKDDAKEEQKHESIITLRPEEEKSMMGNLKPIIYRMEKVIQGIWQTPKKEEGPPESFAFSNGHHNHASDTTGLV